MTKRSIPSKQPRTLSSHDLATATGGYEQGGVEAKEDWIFTIKAAANYKDSLTAWGSAEIH